jgi:Uma2 family endonuclease
MKAQEALNLVDALLDSTQIGQRLNDVQSTVFLGSWLGRTYREIAQQLSYEHDYIKQIGSQLWRSLSLVVGEEVSKKNIKTVLYRYNQSPNKSQYLHKYSHLNSVIPQKKKIMSQPIAGLRWTIHDLEVLPANEWTRYEIINGKLFVERTPHRRHQQVCGKIARQLDAWSESSGLGETIIKPGLIFSEADSVIPDVVWVSRERLVQIEDEAGHLTGAPELVIEVLSPGIPDELRDKDAKLQLYSVHGVREYWIVDRFTKQVEVYRRKNPQLVLVATFFGNDKITSPLLPEFCCSLGCFFPDESL